MFISLTLIPLCICGIISIMSVNMRSKQDVKDKTTSRLQIIDQTFFEMTNSLEFFKVTITSDTNLHLALLQSLNASTLTSSIIEKLEDSMQTIYMAQNTKPYIQSVYLTIEGSPYFINGLERERYEDSADRDWAEIADTMTNSLVIHARDIRKSKFDTRTIPSVTVYYKMKYHELLAINLRQEYFNQWLNSVTEYPEQILTIFNEDGHPLFSNTNCQKISPALLTKALELGEAASDSGIFSESYYIRTKTLEGPYHFRCLSMIPQKEIFKISSTLLQLTLGAGILSIIASSLLAYFFTVRDYQQIFQIIALFDSAEKGEFQTETKLKSVPDSPYFHIINNVVNLFMSQTYLNLQLEAKKYALLTAQMSALQYQLNPHFLFNTLQSIDLEILRISKRPGAANQMIAELSALLRYALDEPTKPVTLQEEIIATKNYIKLQSFKYRDRFLVTWEYPENLLHIPMIRLLLQPIVENSITSARNDSAKKLWIKIKVRQSDSFVIITIIDNGCGITKTTLQSLQQSLAADSSDFSSQHIGLKNINQRLRLTYKNGAVKLWSRESMGTIVELRGIEMNSPLTAD